MTYELAYESGKNLSKGADQFFVYIASQVPLFFPFVLTAFFLIIWISGMQMQKRQEGRDSASMWFLIAAFMTTVLSYLMFLTVGLVNLTTVLICVAIAVVGAIWFFNSKDR